MFLGSSGNNRWEWRKNFMSFCLSFWRLLTSTMLLFWTKLNVRVRVITQNCCCRFFFFFLTTKTLTQFEISGIFLHCRKSILKPWFSSNLDSMRSQLANSNTIQTFRNQFELSCVLCVEMRWVNKKLTEIQIQSKIFPRCLELEETDSKIRNFSTWNVNKNKLGNVALFAVASLVSLLSLFEWIFLLFVRLLVFSAPRFRLAETLWIVNIVINDKKTSEN